MAVFNCEVHLMYCTLASISTFWLILTLPVTEGLRFFFSESLPCIKIILENDLVSSAFILENSNCYRYKLLHSTLSSVSWRWLEQTSRNIENKPTGSSQSHHFFQKEINTWGTRKNLTISNRSAKFTKKGAVIIIMG